MLGEHARVLTRVMGGGRHSKDFVAVASSNIRGNNRISRGDAAADTSLEHDSRGEDGINNENVVSTP